MKALDNNIYVDHHGIRHVKIRDVGYELYGYITSDGRISWEGGFVGSDAGWKTIEPKDQTEDDLKFLSQFETP